MRKINLNDLKYLARKAWAALEEAAKAHESKVLHEHIDRLNQFIKDHKSLMYVELNTIGLPVVGMPPNIKKRMDLLTKAKQSKSSYHTYAICSLDSFSTYFSEEVHAWLKPQVDKLNSVIEELRFNDTSEGLQAINDFIASLNPKPVAKKPAVKKVRKAVAKKASVAQII